jgi:signal transduction histidine kinase
VKAGLRRLRRSLKSRLVLLFVLLAIATTAVFVFGMQRVLQGGWQAYAKPLVADYVDRLAAEIGAPPDAARAQAIVQRLPVSVRIEGPLVQYDSHPERTQRQRRWADHAQGDDDAHELGAAGWGLTRSTADGHRISFGLASPVPGTRPRAVGWLTLGALLLLTLGAYIYVRRMLKPLDDIRTGALRFGGGDFTQPIRQRRADELGDLATQINTMASGLRGMLDAKRALLLAISHELRSPLTRARVNAELVAEGPERDALLRDLGEMRDLIADLLESERLAAGHAALQAEPTDLLALVRDVVDTQFVGDALTLQLSRDVGSVRADATRLRLLLRNLIANALRHGAGAAQGPVVLLRREADGQVALGVRDFGPGVPAEQLPRLAQAFYRVDSARQRSTGGVGLGLHLCRLVAQAHGGTLRFRLAEPGLEVLAVWPVAGV